MMKKMLAILIAMMLLLSATAMAAKTVVDGEGREVKVPNSPQRVISLTPANTEILFALGCGDKVIGVDSMSDYPAEALTIERVGDYSTPNIEAIVAMEPDVIFASNKLQKDAVAQLVSYGQTVICNDPTELDAVPAGISLIAKVMGVDAKPILNDIEQRILDTKRVRVYFALSFGEYGNYTAGPGTFINDIIELLRCKNVADSAPVQWPEYTLEQIVADDPDVILVSDYMGDGAVVEQLKQEPGYSELRCVKAGHVYAVDANITSRPGPRIGEAITVFADAIDSAVMGGATAPADEPEVEEEVTEPAA